MSELQKLLDVLPVDVSDLIHDRETLIEIVLDYGRPAQKIANSRRLWRRCW